jgi:hypothetical protein
VNYIKLAQVLLQTFLAKAMSFGLHEGEQYSYLLKDYQEF